MTDHKNILTKLHSNLKTLHEREAKYVGNAPLELLNQITDHQKAIALTKQVIASELTEVEWREALQPLLVSINQRGGEVAVTIGDVSGGIHGSIIAGGEVKDVQLIQIGDIGGSYNVITTTLNWSSTSSPLARRWTRPRTADQLLTRELAARVVGLTHLLHKQERTRLNPYKALNSCQLEGMPYLYVANRPA